MNGKLSAQPLSTRAFCHRHGDLENSSITKREYLKNIPHKFCVTTGYISKQQNCSVGVVLIFSNIEIGLTEFALKDSFDY